MATDSILDKATRLQDILAIEKDMLLTGRARDAVSLMDEKLGAITSLESALADPELRAMIEDHQGLLRAIAKSAKENAAHFDAIRNGLRHAIDRLQSLHAGAYVGSYGRGGQKVPFTEVTGQFHKKA
ncbi:MAG: hypothetical protein KJ871_13940 [Alphaproteobacteria bacterium]|nr:hypothetical protein [Alphaproteobacteria bacterium]MBU2085448.1 hypothetical protein [Alphaproteobacteria bacterium]MBU2143484.1 hypothetical protein [Alphaproteobacteria bacterium]MBU2196131.1 hypothetical protein [Alphaproteobacteria bacterium]